MPKMKKIILVASAGGHLSQLLKVKSAWEDCKNCVYVTSLEALRGKLMVLGKTHITKECNREHPVMTLIVMIKSLTIILEERPHIVISTGAAPGLICCLWAKLLFRSKVLWLDSIANTEKLSMSGRIIRPFADVILSQWADVALKYKNVEYVGSVF